MPSVNKSPFTNKISSRRLKTWNVKPRPNPSNPVVNGKIINSLGSIINNNSIVKKYVMTLVRNEITATITIGAVANGLMKKPIPGKKPPADCKIAANPAINAPNSIFSVSDQRIMKR